MITQEQYLKKWLPIEKGSCPPFICQRIGEERLHSLSLAEVQRSFELCFEAPTAKAWKGFELEGTTISDFQNKLISTPFGDVVAAIRFIGRDKTKPAVFLIHKEFELNDPVIIKQIGILIKAKFSIFSPQRMRWFSPAFEAYLINENDFITGDLFYVAEFIDTLQARQFPENYDMITLKPPISLDWYARYQAEFVEIYKQNPAFKEMAEAESLETLQELKEKGLLFEIYIEKKWAGIIGVDEYEEKFLEGYVVYEQLLVEKYRGKGFAPLLQRHLIERLPAKGMLFGTIHYGNPASWKTAFKVGRKAAGIYLFADI